MRLQALKLGGATILDRLCAHCSNRVSSSARLHMIARWRHPCCCRFQYMGVTGRFSSRVGYVNSPHCAAARTISAFTSVRCAGRHCWAWPPRSSRCHHGGHAQACAAVQKISAFTSLSLRRTAQAAAAGPGLEDLPGAVLVVTPRPCIHFSLSLRRPAQAGSWA